MGKKERCQGKGGGGEFHARIIGTALAESEKAAAFILGMGGDNDTNYQLMDHTCVGIKKHIRECQEKSIPFFMDMKFTRIEMKFFPYSVPLVQRQCRGMKFEPFFNSRDPSHVLNALTRALCSPAYAIHFGETAVHHGHTLETSIPPRAFLRQHGQSGLQAAERISHRNFLRDGKVDVPWCGRGHLLFSFILRLAMRPWWAPQLGPYERFHFSAIAYHFFEGARMLAAEAGNMRKRFLAGLTYLCIHRTLIHQIFRTKYWPEDWPKYVGLRQIEWFAEMRFEQKRRLGPPHNQGAREWIISTWQDLAVQLQKLDAARKLIKLALQDSAAEASAGASTPVLGSSTPQPQSLTRVQQKPIASVAKEDIAAQNQLAMKIAMRLLAFCCPRSLTEKQPPP